MSWSSLANMRPTLTSFLLLFLADGFFLAADSLYNFDYSNHPNWWLLPTGSCGRREEFDNRIGTRVLGGTDAELGQYPWIAELVTLNSEGFEHICGGSIINDRYILTAAHCVEDDTEVLMVRVGELTRSTYVDCSKDRKSCAPPAIVMDIEDVVIHPNFFYTGTFFAKNDIALIRLRHQIERFNDFISPICLPTFSKDEMDLDNHYIMEAGGWGTTLQDTISDTLQTIKVPTVPRQQCEERWWTLCIEGDEPECLIDIHENVICANTRIGKGTCYGDSGGPLMTPLSTPGRGTSMFLIGITSYGEKSCEWGFPDVYTRVSEYVPWILDNIHY